MAVKSDWVDGQPVYGSDMNAVADQINTNTTAITNKADSTAVQPRFMTGTVATAVGTVAKTVTLDSPWAAVAPATGDFFLITFANGTNISNPTLAINGTTVRPIRTPALGTTSAHTTITAGTAVLLYFDGTGYTLMGATQNSSYTEITQAEIIDTAQSSTRVITGRRAEDLMVNEATKARTLTNKTLTDPKINRIKDTNGNNSTEHTATASAVNYLRIGNAPTGIAPYIRGMGGDTNVNVAVAASGAGTVRLQDGNFANVLTTAAAIASAVNYLTATNAATGTAPSLAANGTDTNIDLNLLSKGTGVVKVNGVQIDRSPDIQTFTGNGTWTKPAGAVSVNVWVVCAGGGGGAGARGPSGTALSGGGGGGGGSSSQATFAASQLTATVPVTLPAGGLGAVGQTVDGTAGAAGSPTAGAATFGSYLAASRSSSGGGGGGGLAVAGTAGGAGTAQFNGAVGGVGSATGAAGAIGANAAGAAGGGAGGGITTGAVASAGGNGGALSAASGPAVAGGTAGGGAGTPGAAGGAGLGGTGGAGGGANAAGAGGNGGNGGNYGAGGGGGGASLNGSVSGAGGNGGGGFCQVVTYF
jgi:hypothetical protein